MNKYLKYVKFFFLASFAMVIIACSEAKKEVEIPFQKEIALLKSKFAPDKRVALFNIEAIKKNNNYILKGESNLPDAVLSFKNQLSSLNVDFIDSIQLLPAANLAEKTQGIINISVANLRSNPKHSAELATQATLGMPVKVLKKEGDWSFVQTPDKYLSWVDAGGLTLMNAVEYKKWQTAGKIIFTKTYGESYTSALEEEIVSDLVAGNVLEVINKGENHFKVSYPDGREAFVPIENAESYSVWLEKMNPSEDDLIATSKTLMGVPYLWGGTSTKGVDCSGFTKTIYFLNGMVIPRDASQQVHAGKPIDSIQNFENLRKGDLLFFGNKATDTTAEKVVHVGMWIGDNQFIHASNMVRVSSMDPKADNFDEFNRNRYLRTKRILREKDDALINLTQTPLFKD